MNDKTQSLLDDAYDQGYARGREIGRTEGWAEAESDDDFNRKYELDAAVAKGQAEVCIYIAEWAEEAASKNDNDAVNKLLAIVSDFTRGTAESYEKLSKGILEVIRK